MPYLFAQRKNLGNVRTAIMNDEFTYIPRSRHSSDLHTYTVKHVMSYLTTHFGVYS